MRNRIIAGMPLGVVIVEGKKYSGSLIPAWLAMEFGREVFGVPGNVTHEVSFAPNEWIKQGAKLVTSDEDVIEELPTPIRAALGRAGGRGGKAKFARRGRVNSNRGKDLRAFECGRTKAHRGTGRNDWVEFQRSSGYAL